MIPKSLVGYNIPCTAGRTCCRGAWRGHKVPFPDTRLNHVNPKKAFAIPLEIKPCGMKRALEILRIPLAASHHRAIDDARNIAKVARTAGLFE